jgi:hypothetical protein
MRFRTPALLSAGLGLLTLAGWMATFPRPNPRPELPEIEPFQAGEPVALILGDATAFPPADSLGLVQRARAAGAEVRVFSTRDDFSGFRPNRVFQPAPWPESPSGYHPDQWPVISPTDTSPGIPWQILTLAPCEIAAKNAAVVETARVLRESGTDDVRGTRELQVLSRARRAEIYSFFTLSADFPKLE